VALADTLPRVSTVPPNVSTEQLRGRLVTIRPFASEDAQALLDLRLRNDEFFRPFEPSSVVVPATLAEQQTRLEGERTDWAGDRGYVFGIFRSSDDLLVGRIALSNIARGAWQNGILGYFVDREHIRRGYATEAARLALRFAFDSAGLHRVMAGVMPRNEASIKVLRAAGFRHESTALKYLEIQGTWEDHEIFAITREDWAEP
jgi:[ribosomal protein S5]-alanine N-acetyltransferase